MAFELKDGLIVDSESNEPVSEDFLKEMITNSVSFKEVIENQTKEKINSVVAARLNEERKKLLQAEISASGSDNKNSELISLKEKASELEAQFNDLRELYEKETKESASKLKDLEEREKSLKSKIKEKISKETIFLAAQSEGVHDVDSIMTILQKHETWKTTKLKDGTVEEFPRYIFRVQDEKGNSSEELLDAQSAIKEIVKERPWFLSAFVKSGTGHNFTSQNQKTSSSVSDFREKVFGLNRVGY